MDLILWRHAEAEDGVPDVSRKLTAKGTRQAKRMAEWLQARLPENTRVIASPARRTLQTAAALTEHCVSVSGLGVGASVSSVLDAAGWPRARGAVVVVGHQPVLGQVAAYLLTGAAADWSIRKGGVWWLRSRARDGGGETVLRAVIGPDLI